MSNNASESNHPFSAAGSMTGYLFQCRYALLDALRRMRREVDFQVYFETLDDVVFEQQGKATELLQTKHHIKRSADLTGASVDLWKTLRIWCEGIAAGSIRSDSRFMLVTTSSAADDSVVSLLRYGDGRSVSAALDRLRSISVTSSNKTNASAYAAFRALTMKQQSQLLESVYVIDAVHKLTSLNTDLRQEVFHAVDRQLLDAFLTRLEGWWFRRIIKHLVKERNIPVLSVELIDEMSNLRDQLREDNLPIDDEIEQMKFDATGYQDRVFVHQLHLIQISNERIVRAIRDYYRAFVQRSIWVRDELIGVGDLERYEERLKDTWEGRFLVMRDELGQTAAEAEQSKFARQLFKWVETEELPRIRPRCADGFVARGSYQILADHLIVGWHPEFKARLRHLLQPEVLEASE